MAYLIDKNWIAASALTGIQIGDTLSIQNAGRAGDLVELILSNSEPLLSDRGYVVRNIDPLYRVSGQGVELWIRYIRYDLTGTITPQDARKCLVNIMDNEQIAEASALPVDIYTGEDSSKRIKTETSTIQETSIIDGRFYSGGTLRENVSITDTPNDVVVVAGPGGLVIDDLIISIDFSSTTDGIFGYELKVYIDSSNGNSWSYTPLAPMPAGRALNTGFINNLPLSTIDNDVTASVAGSADFIIYFSDYYIDTSGNRNSESVTESSFFDSGRQLIIAPNEKVLIRAEITGNATGTADIRSIFFISEPE